MLLSIKPAHALTVGLGIAYLVGILSTYHLLPSYTDLLIGLQVTTVLSFTLATFFFTYKNKMVALSLSSLTWLFLGVLIFIQPFLSQITYPDALVFPFLTCILLMFVSIMIKQMIANDIFTKQAVCRIIAIFLTIGGIATTIILLLQLFKVNIPFIVLSLLYDRPGGNVWQPNQAAFILCLAIVSVLYLKEEFIRFKKISIIFGSILLFLGVGIALTGSRTGMLIILGIPVLHFLIYGDSFKLRFKYYIIISIILAISYAIGTYILKQHAGFAASGISRIAHESVNERMLLQHLASSLFLDHPITGYGWGNYTKGGLEHAVQNNWLILAFHSHVVVTQIAAELGMIGLLIFIPLAWIIFKNLSFKMNAPQAFAFMIVVVTLIYSMSEFPLWYLRFSMIFAICIVLLDPTSINLKSNYNFIFAGLSLIIFVCSIIYQKEYFNYYSHLNKIYNHQMDTQQIGQIKNVFGFNRYKDEFIFSSLALDNHYLEQKIALGNRVNSKTPSAEFLEKQAVYEALNRNNQRALILFKTKCILNYYKDCGEVERTLEEFSKKYPVYFTDIYRNFLTWKKSSNIK